MRWEAGARILIAKTCMNFTNYDTDCPNCGLPSVRKGQFCPGCGVWLPTDQEGVAPTGDADAVPWTLVHVTAGLFLFLGLIIAVAFISGALGDLLPDYGRALRTWIGVHLLALGIAFLVWILGVRSAGNPLGSLGLRQPKTALGMSVLLAAVALAASLLLTFVYGFVVDRLGIEYLRPPDIDEDVIFPGVGILLTFQALSLVTPISEELLFRGFVLQGLLKSMGPGPAVVASALVFAALHLEPGAIIPIFFTGIALGWLFVRTGSLWVCIAAHAGQNSLALLATRFL